MGTLRMNLGPVASLADRQDSEGIGTYLLTECSEREGESGQRHLQLVLEDTTGRVNGFVWPECRSSVQPASIHEPVQVVATVRSFEGRPQLRVQAMCSLKPWEAGAATLLLPRHRCPEPARGAFDRMAKLEHDLPSPLDGFMARALLDSEIGLPFLRCRASVRHHHAYAGGLLVHSTEMLDLIRQQVELLLPGDPWAPHVAQLAYLFHDVGKLRSVGESRRGQFGLVVRHEIITIELLAPHLRWLEQQDLKLAMALRYVLDYLAVPASARRVPHYAVAEIVAVMDQWSACSYNQHDLENLLSLGRPRIAAFDARQPGGVLDVVLHS